MARNDTENYNLGQAINILLTKRVEETTPKEQKELVSALKLYAAYCKIATGHDPDHRVIEDGLSSLATINIIPELQAILDWKPSEKQIQAEEGKEKQKKKKEETEEETNDVVKAPLPEKEASTVPAELETLVALYKDNQADKIESDTTHTVADAVKRARKTWETRHQAELIRENRLKAIEESQGKEASNKQAELEDSQQESFLIQTVNPKVESSYLIYRDVQRLARETIDAQGIELTESQANKAADDLAYLILSGGVDPSNKYALYIDSQLAIKNVGGEILSELNNVDESVKKWQSADIFSEEKDQYERDIVLADQDAERKVREESQDFENLVSDKKSPIYKDYEDHIEAAVRSQSDIQEKLLKAIPNAILRTTPDPLAEHAAELENAIRAIDPTIRINSEGTGARVSAILKITGGTRNITAETARLISLGITPDNFDKHLKFAQDEKNKDTPLGILYRQHPDVFKQVQHSLRVSYDSKIGQEIRSDMAPVTGMTRFYNSLPSGVRSATKFILNPKGTIYSWANQQIGSRIGKELLKNTGSAVAQRLGNFLINEGLQNGIKTFAKQAAQKLVVEGAKKIGVTVVGDSLVATVAVALGIPTAGASLIIGAILILLQIILDATIGYIKKRLDEIWRELGWGEKFRTRDVIGALAMGGASIASVGAGTLGTLIVFGRVAYVAAVSAVGIIIAAIVTVGLYAGAALLVAPALSTLVQLDSKEKVKYDEYLTVAPVGDCGWPTAGHYPITTGPLGGTHSLSKLQAIDIAAPNLSPHLSGTNGVVVYTGPYSNYGNTVHVQVKTSAGSFKVIYGHLATISVSVGQQIKQGQKIGLVGGSGGWSPHIHMEYVGIKYNQCPAGGLQIKEYCCSYGGANCHGLCNAFSN